MTQSRYFRLCALLLPAFSMLLWIGESRSSVYAVSEFFLTYKHGFIRRALTGQILSVLPVITPLKLRLIEFGLTAVLLLLAYVVLWRMLTRSVESGLLALVFLCSPAMLPHFSSLAAQPDTQLFALVLIAYACLVFLRVPWSPLVAVVPCIVAILVHEAFVLLFYPALLLLLWDGVRSQRFSRLAAMAHVAIVGLAFLSVMHFSHPTVPPETMLQEAQQRTSIPLNPEAFFTISGNLHQQWQTLMQHYSKLFFAGVMISMVFLLPYLAGVVKLVKTVNARRAKPVQGYVLALAAFGPLVLCFLGHDVERWVAGSVLSLQLFVVYLYQTEEKGTQAMDELARGPLVLGTLLYGMAIGPMGGATVQVMAHAVQFLLGQS